MPIPPRASSLPRGRVRTPGLTPRAKSSRYLARGHTTGGSTYGYGMVTTLVGRGSREIWDKKKFQKKCVEPGPWPMAPKCRVKCRVKCRDKGNGARPGPSCQGSEQGIGAGARRSRWCHGPPWSSNQTLLLEFDNDQGNMRLKNKTMCGHQS